MIDVSDLRPTIVPKSDQLNAEQLLTGPITITVTDVRVTSSEDQPVTVYYENDAGRPFKPCKTMRKVLVLAWGQDGREWVGKSATLYQDPTVKFGGAELGGIRISHLTDIPKDIRVSLTATKGKKAMYEVKRMESPDARAMSAIRTADTVDDLKALFGAAYKATKDQARRDALKQAYDARMSMLTMQSKSIDEISVAAKLNACADVDVLDLAADDLREIPDEAMRARLTEVYKARRTALQG